MEIPRRLEGLEYFLSEMGVLMQEISKLIDNAFKKAGMTIVPPIIRYVLCSAILLSPCLGLLFMICCGQDDEPASPQAAPSQTKIVGGKQV